MKIFTQLFSFLLLLFLCSCGHNIVQTDKGIGIALKIPLPNGGSLIDVKLGYIDCVTTMIRGNTTVDASTTSGGAALSLGGGTSQVVLIKTGPQLNEGYIAQILSNPNVDAQTKKYVAQYLVNAKPLHLKPTSLTVANGGISTGQNPVQAKSVKGGFDNIVDKVSQGYKSTVDNTKNGAVDVSNIFMKYIYQICIGIGIIFAIVVLTFIILHYKHKKKLAEILQENNLKKE